ncbi:DUF3300 domain-containing protein [Xanthomonas oryzae pv. oryzae]|uniref:DUF3300 domain-containing protein n=12 Tax=Xanthomonas oryzae TaxID=347 RepID=UPI000B2C8A73|nr:DUF3300 domain-containing protein [Xanthomonas oryzae]UXW36425.1 DUF3300 domain-containing protein [Xanthomonas oryzae pv. oryzae]UXW43043.1 DUF3300 domain-containing protein [Xanthomonas oryzae pv. oryzae]
MQRTWSQGRLALALSIASTGMIALGGCQRAESPAPAAAEPPPPPGAVATPAYTPPTADQLYQLVAPIALFPDKLLAQTLAASVYPDQVVTAQEWLRSNSGLSAADRAQATVSQSWDPSIKALTAFPDVVSQLAGNLDWTRALGDAYAHDPNDVLNAVQIMRQRAQASGHLRSTPQQQVQVARHVVVTPILDEGRIPPPSQMITIEPAERDVVYVPHYDPGVVYGTPVDVYREYRYRPVRWYDEGDVVTTGLVSFGVGVLVGGALEHHHGWFGWAEPAPAWHSWGWNSWGVNWNAPPAAPHYVVYQNHVYAPRTTIINNRNTYIDSRSYVNQDQRHWSNATSAPAPVAGIAPIGFHAARAAALPAAIASAQGLRGGAGAGAPAPSPAQLHRPPDYAHLAAPHFNAQMLQPGRPVAMNASSPLSHAAPLTTVAHAMQPPPAGIHSPHMQAPAFASVTPLERVKDLQAAQQRMAQLHAESRAAQEKAAAANRAHAAMPPRDAFASRDARNNPFGSQAQPVRWKPPVQEQRQLPPHQQFAFAASPRGEHAQPSQPRYEPRPVMKPEPQQHMQRMASFTPPRAAPARPADTHQQRPHPAAQPQYHDHHHS